MFSQFRQAALDVEGNTEDLAEETMRPSSISIRTSAEMMGRGYERRNPRQSYQENTKAENLQTQETDSKPTSRRPAVTNSHRDPLARINALRGNINRSPSSTAKPTITHYRQSYIAENVAENTSNEPKRSRNFSEGAKPRAYHDQPDNGVVTSRIDYQRRSASNQPPHQHIEEAAHPHPNITAGARETNKDSSQGRHQPSPSLSRNIMNFEDLPAAVSTRQEVGVVNDFQVPEVVEVEKDTQADSERDAAVGRPKPKMLRRGDGTRKLTEKLEKYQETVVAAAAAPPKNAPAPALSPQVLATTDMSKTPESSKSAGGIQHQRQPIVNTTSRLPKFAEATTIEHRSSDAPVSTTNTPIESTEYLASVAKPNRFDSFRPIPKELMTGLADAVMSQDKISTPKHSGRNAPTLGHDHSVSNPHAEAIRTHLMSVFGAGLDTTIGGSWVDAEAASILEVDISNFPKYLSQAIGGKGGNPSSNTSSASASIASFLHERDSTILSYLDVRRMEFLANMFPSLPQDRYSNLARFTNGPEGFTNSGQSVLKPHQYHTIVKQFDGMEE